MSCLLVSCPSISDPTNGVIVCSLGDDGVASYEDTCNFTCNTGYELTGSESRTCQSDGSWSGSIAMCTRSEYHLYTYVRTYLLLSSMCYGYYSM